MAAVYKNTSSCPARPRVVAIGNFDGVHLGHQAVLQAGRRMAERLGATLMACTFNPAPTAILAPERHQPRICQVGDRVDMLQEAGAEEVLIQPFTKEFSQQNPIWFFEEFLMHQLCAVGVVVGHDFRFGKGRAADAAQMQHIAACTLPKIDVEVLSALTAEAGAAEGAVTPGIISSSRIRQLVQAGEVRAATALLGRPHFLRGLVVGGERRGRLLGFPTANLNPLTELLPMDGVYACRAYIAHRSDADLKDAGGLDGGGLEASGIDVGEDDPAGSGPYPSVVNFGYRPTFDGLRHRIEAHLLDYSGNLYGRQLCIELVARVRDEQKFDGPEALKQQIRQDILQARALLSAEGAGGEGAGEAVTE